MSRMVENLLDLSKLQAGAVSPHSDWLDSRELVEASVDELRRESRRAGLLRPELGQTAAGARRRITAAAGGGEPARERAQVLAEGAPVLVEVGVSDGHVEIAVADSGPGIAAEDAERIFEPFYRPPGGRPQPAPASGWRSHAGWPQPTAARSRSSTQPGAGSPLHAAAAGAAGKGRVSGNTRILVVDDERPIRRALEVTLAQGRLHRHHRHRRRRNATQAALDPPDLVDPRPDAAGRRRRRRLPPAARLAAGADPADLGRRRGERQGARARRRRRRLPDQAVRHRRAAGTGAGAAAPLGGCRRRASR